MARIFVESWSPEYGTPLDPDESLAPADGSVDTGLEHDSWAPVQGVDDGVARIAFVDGVRRVDARITLDDPIEGPTPGLVGSFAVGAAVWDRPARRSEVTEVRVERWAVLGNGRSEVMPPVDLEPGVGTTTCPTADPHALTFALHNRMREAEGALAESLAEICAVIADGPLKKIRAHETVGLVKSHHVRYLPPECGAVIAELAPGQRTPLFAIALDTAYSRYAWYLRLAMTPGGHSWTGIVRCELSAQVPLDRAAVIANRTAAVLPVAASEPHVDPRAPQNLVPIGALERELRHRLGDRGLVERALREAVARREEPIAS